MTSRAPSVSYPSSGGASGFGDQTQFLPKSFLRFDDVIVGDQQRLRDEFLRDGKHQLAHTACSKGIRGNAAYFNVNNLSGCQGFM